MIGNVGSGKTTWVRKFMSEALERGEKWVVISKDAIRFMFGGGEQYIYDVELEEIVEAVTMRMFEGLLEKKCNIIIDETNMRAEVRNRFLSYLFLDSCPPELLFYEVTAVVMPSLPKEESLRRKSLANYGQDQSIWEKVWERKLSLYEPPEYDEGFDHILFRIDSDILDFEVGRDANS
jgi:tRNA uridine 5-carbamoylmethylation protein Kti12